ncbi:MAG: hypothetical protein ACP6IP_01140 [Candidatus Njordarchaeia archaeon]
MQGFSLELFNRVKCPLCGREVRSEDLPELNEDMGRVAVDHEDHVLVIKYDNHGFIRTAEPYKVKKETDKTDIYCMDKCPLCGKPVVILNGSIYPNEYAYIHGDHVVIVFVLDRGIHFLEAIPLISPKESNAELLYGRLLNALGEKGLAILLSLLVMNFNGVIHVPYEVVPIVKELFRMYNRDQINIVAGGLEDIGEEKFSFFLRMIRINKKNIEYLSDKIKGTMVLIDKIIEMLDYLTKNKKRMGEVRQLVDLLRRRGLWGVIRYRLERERSQDLVSLIESL